MSTTPNPAAPMAEAFSQFWSDFMGRAGAAGFAPQPPGSPDAMKQMQRVFLDALAKYADDYMRSPAFLEQLKQTMDNAMAMKQQIDGFLASSLKAMHMPSREDTGYTIEMLHGLERRLGARLDAIEQRLAAHENGHSPAARPAAERAHAAKPRAK